MLLVLSQPVNMRPACSSLKAGRNVACATGASKVVHWEQRFVLHAASAFRDHPLNRKVRLSVPLRTLQREAGLSASGLAHLVRVAGPRVRGGRLVLVCDRHADSCIAHNLPLS
jgi:hypothetical protein